MPAQSLELELDRRGFGGLTPYSEVSTQSGPAPPVPAPVDNFSYFTYPIEPEPAPRPVGPQCLFDETWARLPLDGLWPYASQHALERARTCILCLCESQDGGPIHPTPELARHWCPAGCYGDPINLKGKGLSHDKFVLPINPILKISEQHPLTSDEDLYEAVPDGFRYLFNNQRSISAADSVSKASILPICGQILEPGYVSYVVHYTGYVNELYPGCGSCPSHSPQYHNVPFVPFPSQPELNKISTCNPFADATCVICKGKASISMATLSVTHPQMDRPGDPLAVFGPLNFERIIFESECLLITREDCGVRTCGNGQYASDYLNLDPEGYVTSNVQCLPCKPGTWLTCPEDAQCTYNIPASRGDPFMGGTSVYSPTGQTPVGGCFTCETAGSGKCHYSKTGRGSCIVYGAADPLPWYCPGGSEAPVQCGHQFAGSDENHTVCVCSPGSFGDGVNGCVLCPAGYECSGGALRACPDHTYQDAVGQTACYRCTTDGTATGAPLAACPANQVLRQCTGRFRAEPPLCVPCNMCVRDYVASPAGRVDCY